MSAAVQGHLAQLLDIMQANSINRKTIDWPDFRQEVQGTAPNAQTMQDLYPAIRKALGLLNDHHSHYQAPDGSYVHNPLPAGVCSEPTPPEVQVPEGIGYVKVGGFSGSESQARDFAQDIHDRLRTADRPNLAGWVVDLRDNGGGNMWPMVAGLGPILGEGTAGAFVDPDGVFVWWGYAIGASLNNGRPLVTVSKPYQPYFAKPRVAVLTNCRVASSGEATVIAFRARPDARSFGTPTFGLSTANRTFTLAGGGTLVLCVSTMADRAGRVYGGPVAPDEVITDPVETVRRAVEWLRQ
jgi:C-terminal processing protease CtpA/Prc